MGALKLRQKLGRAEGGWVSGAVHGCRQVSCNVRAASHWYLRRLGRWQGTVWRRMGLLTMLFSLRTLSLTERRLPWRRHVPPRRKPSGRR
jgi:hypothetical protein